MAHINFVAGAVVNGFELHVGVVEHIENFTVRVREKPHFAEQFFFFLGENNIFVSNYFSKEHVVVGKAFALCEFFKSFL